MDDNGEGKAMPRNENASSDSNGKREVVVVSFTIDLRRERKRNDHE